MKKALPVVVLLLAGAGYFAWSRWNLPNENELTLSGNIEFKKIDISFKTAGKLLSLAVDEGADVKQGMELARLDRDQVSKMRLRDSASVDMAQSQLQQLVTGIRYQKTTLESEIALRQAELRQAQAKLQELLDGARPQEIESAKATVADLRSLLEQARKDYQRAQKLIEKEDISQSQFDQYRARFDSLSAQLRNAEQRLALLVEGPRKTDIEAARAAVARADAQLKFTQAQSLDIQRKEQDLAARKADIARTQASVSVIDSQLEDTVAIAPVSGVVLTKSADPGEVLAAGSPVLTIGDIDHPWLRGYVPEAKLGRIQLGMPVEVRTDSYPGKTYAGRITFIASEAEFTPKQIQTKEERVKLVYRIKVEMANPNRELKLNMPVDAVIRLK